MTDSESPIVVAALYRFVRLENYELIRDGLQNLLNENGVVGSLLLAREGINGTIAGTRDGIDAVICALRKDHRLRELEVKESYCDSLPFKRSRVRLKREIVTMGVEGIDPNHCVGTYVDPKDWNALISDPEITLIDTRNDYEVAIGSFPGAVNPKTTTFREFPEYVDQELDPTRHTKVAMFCTGGIRCEKSTAYLKEQGFEEVYHLRGGILKYLETIPSEESLWEGECFVFDERVSVGQDVEQGTHKLCFACGWPVDGETQQHPDYVPGVHCPRCVNDLTEEQKRRFAERQRQHVERANSIER